MLGDIIGYDVIDPFFINGNLSSEGYLRLLRESVLPKLRKLFSNYQNSELPAETIWFQQDGAPPHFGRQVRRYLMKLFLADG